MQAHIRFRSELEASQQRINSLLGLTNEQLQAATPYQLFRQLSPPPDFVFTSPPRDQLIINWGHFGLGRASTGEARRALLTRLADFVNIELEVVRAHITRLESQQPSRVIAARFEQVKWVRFLFLMFSLIGILMTITLLMRINITNS